MLDPILDRATRLLWRGRYGDAIAMLQPEVVRYYDSFNYYYILGCACLRAGDMGGAFTYYNRAREIKREPATLLGIALCYLHRGDTGKAADLYLEALAQDPRSRIAKKGLQVLRKHGGAEGIQGWLDTGKISQLFPPRPKRPFKARRLLLPMAAALLALALAAGILAKLGVLPLGRVAAPERAGLAGIALEREDRAAPVDLRSNGGAYRYILTQSQVLELYETAFKLFAEYRDEAAKPPLNRLLESNASEPIKNKARLLLSYAEVPGFDTLKDRLPYAEARQDPVLYRDCHVIWRGMATNLVAGESATAFDFLVGYDTRSTLEGIVPVSFGFSAAIDPERPLEVLGRIVPTGEGMRLEGVALHQAPR